MSSPSIKWIAAFAVAVMFSLAPLALAQKLQCASVTALLDKTSAAPGEFVYATASVTNCGKGSVRYTVQFEVTDSCGYSQIVAAEPLRLKGSETLPKSVSFPAPTCDATVTVKVIDSDGSVLAHNSAGLTISTTTTP